MSTIWRETGLEITSWASSIKCFKYGGSHTLISWPLYFYTLDSLIIRCLHWGSHKPLQKEHSSIFFSISVPLEATKYIHTLYLYVWHRLHKRPQMLAFGCVSNWPRSFFYYIILSFHKISTGDIMNTWATRLMELPFVCAFTDLLSAQEVCHKERWSLMFDWLCAYLWNVCDKAALPRVPSSTGKHEHTTAITAGFHMAGFYRQWHFTTILGWGSSIY